MASGHGQKRQKENVSSGGPRGSSDASNRASGASAMKKGGGGAGSMRSSATVRRLNTYRKKAIRDKKGKIIKQEYQSKELPSTRIVPDRRWFGNTRVVDQKQMARFQEAVDASMTDNYKVLLKERKLPMGLFQQQKAPSSKAVNKVLLQQQSFDDTFGKKKKRKRPKLSGQADGLQALVSKADKMHAAWNNVEGEEEDTLGDVGAEEEKTIERMRGGAKMEADRAAEALDGLKNTAKDGKFEKGQSKRIWGELYKVIDSSDVIIQVLDSRDPYGTRSKFLESHIKRNCPHKHVILLLNKCDLVPGWVTKRYLYALSREFPTIAFHASVTNPFGKGALLSLLRQLARIKSDKQSVCVGFVGYPNVGKSSVINTLRTKKVCKTAPIPGETKVWQYITLTKKIMLIDCPGVVYNRCGDTDTDAVLKGVIRIENLEHAYDYIPEVLRRVLPAYLKRAYGIGDWETPTEFLEHLARATGKLLKGGEADLNTAAKMLLHDWQRGRIPYFKEPPMVDEGKGKGAKVTGQEGKKEDDDFGLTEAAVKLAEKQAGETMPVKAGMFQGDDITGPGGADRENTTVGEEEDDVKRQVNGDNVADKNATLPFKSRHAARKKASTATGKRKRVEPTDNDEGDEDSDGYGEGGLSWTEVMKSMM